MRNFDDELERQRMLYDMQEAPPFLFCEKCNAEIYRDEEYYTTEENYVLCEECFDKWQEEQKIDCQRIAGDD